ncbi:MAG: hypothetical protein ACREQB_05785 [Candidatus Binataceae bacterium]
MTKYLLARTARSLAGAALTSALVLGAAGCVAAAAAAALAPTVLSGATFAAVQGARATQGDESSKETEERCDQLVRGTPTVSEIRRSLEGRLSIRPMALVRKDSGAQWTYANTGAPNLPGDATFTPPLAEAVADDETRYLAYAPTIADTAAEGEQATTLAVVFGGVEGTIRTNSRTYNFALVPNLPCYPAPE